MSNTITIEENIEQAINALIQTAINQNSFEHNLDVVTTVYDTLIEDRVVSYPCVVVACSPFQNDTPGSILGYCSLTVSCMTEQNDDKMGSVMNQICSFVYPLISKNDIGLLILSPWLLCGINDTETTEVNVDEDTNVNIRTREFSIALAKVSA